MLDLFDGREVRRGSKAGEFFMCCDFCEERVGKKDTKFHLGFNIYNGRWHCFRCDAGPKTHGQLKNLKTFTEFNEVPASDDLISQIEKNLDKISQPRKQKFYDLELMSFELSLQVTPFAYDYITERGFSDEDIKKYNLRVGKEFVDPETNKTVYRWKGRILFPFFENGKCVYIVGRSYLGKQPKYINTSGSKNSIVYGLDRLDKNKECIVTEGIISAIAAERETGIPAVCLLGKSASDWQLSKIRNKANKVYLSLDGGVDDDSVKNKCLRDSIDTYKVILPKDKDPDDVKTEYKTFFANKKTTSF